MFKATPWAKGGKYVATSGSVLRVVKFDDQPRVWWFTNGHLLLRGKGKAPVAAVHVPFVGKPWPFSRVATARTKRAATTWEKVKRCDLSTGPVFGMRSSVNHGHGIDAKYHHVVSQWPRSITWMAPVNPTRSEDACWAVDDKGVIVAVVMPIASREVVEWAVAS